MVLSSNVPPDSTPVEALLQFYGFGVGKDVFYEKAGCQESTGSRIILLKKLHDPLQAGPVAHCKVARIMCSQCLCYTGP